MIFHEPTIHSFPSAQANDTFRFSIVIPTWNNLDYLKLCIRSIEQNSTYRHQLIIHVNEGTDGTLEWIKSTPYAYTFSSENAGVCYAVNAAAKLAVTDYIVYFNDDMYACPGWDEILCNAIQQRGDIYFYYSATMIEPESGTNKAVCAPFDFGRDTKHFNEAELLSFAAQLQHTNWYGSCWPPSIVHKTLWEKAGGYSTEFSPGFYSDPDFAMKLWNLGVRDFRGFGKSLVYHFKCKSTGRVVRNNGRKTFMKKWGISSSFLYKHVLRMGEPCREFVPLTFNKGIAYFISRIKSKLA